MKNIEPYEKNLKKASKIFRKTRKSINSIWKIIFSILRFLITFILSPLTILLLLIIVFFGWLYMLVTHPWETIKMKKNPSIILNKEKVLALWLGVYKEGNHKWKIKGCESFHLPKNIYTSFVEWYSEEVFKINGSMYKKFCLYHLLYLKKIKWEYSFKKEKELINKINKKLELSNDLNEKQIIFLKQEKEKLEKKINLTKNVLKLINLKNVGENKFKNYKKDEYWFKKYIDYPISYFKENQKNFLDILYLNYIWSTYWESYPEWISLWWSLFGIWWEEKLYYNMLLELWTEYSSNNIATEFLNGNFWLPDFINDINNKWNYYNYNCPTCKKEEWCDCSWDPEEDYNRNFWEENLWLTYFRWYLNFINDLKQKKIVYVSDSVKSPFRDYLQWNKLCKVNIVLTQRDGPSNLSFWFFKLYPKVNWVRTHAGLDLATYDNCNKKDVPIYSITEGIVLFKSYSTTSWGNSIIIKTNINNEIYYIRYSHLKKLPKLSIWEYVSTNTLIGIQWTSWPSTWEHLDLTIYNGTLNYKDYLHNTLNWWWLFDFSFLDMMKTWFSDYTVWNLDTKRCFNCKKNN